MPKVIHFEIHADGPERAVSFYTKVFGWKAQKRAGQARPFCLHISAI